MQKISAIYLKLKSETMASVFFRVNCPRIRKIHVTLNSFLGLTVSLMNSIKESLNFTTTRVQPEDGFWGSLVFNSSTNTSSWNGMVRFIQDGNADLGTPGFAVSKEREEVLMAM